MPRSTTAPDPDTDTDMDTDMDQDEFLTIERSNSIDVTDPEKARSLLAQWRGVYWFFNGRAEWKVDEAGNVSAINFSTRSDFDPETILRDVSGKDRRLEFGPAYLIVTGKAPAEFTDPQEITNFTVNYTKGSTSDGTSKNPDYLRTGINQYKTEHGLQTRRGRRKKILRLDNMESLDEEALRGVKVEDLDKLIAIAEAARSNRPAPVSA